MKETYVFDYVNENEFRKLERSIKKYNMLAYKKLYFEYYPSTDSEKDATTYELGLPTDAMFSKVHGEIKLYYIVYNKEKVVMLDKFEPIEILNEGHASELVTYKGVMVSKEHAEKDMFKINLLKMIQK